MKKIFIMLLAVFIVCIYAGCSNGNTDTKEESSNDDNVKSEFKVEYPVVEEAKGLKIDYASNETYNETVEAIRQALPEEKRNLFVDSISFLFEYKNEIWRAFDEEDKQKYKLQEVNVADDEKDTLGVKIVLDQATVADVWEADRKIRSYVINDSHYGMEMFRYMVENRGLAEKLSFKPVGTFTETQEGYDHKTWGYTFNVTNHSEKEIYKIVLDLTLNGYSSIEQSCSADLDENPLKAGETRTIKFSSSAAAEYDFYNTTDLKKVLPTILKGETHYYVFKIYEERKDIDFEYEKYKREYESVQAGYKSRFGEEYTPVEKDYDMIEY